jgi:uncharacterized RDD family membrane protein YckC
MFEGFGLTSKEIGLLVIAPAFAMLFNLPIFIYKEYLLAMNVGGALIPIVLSIHFLKKDEIPLIGVIIGIIAVSIPTFMVTKFVANVGVVSQFPYYLIPPIIASILSLAIFSSDSSKTPGYSYAIATLGVLIGGDVFHLPEIFQHPFIGSMGGAGIYDMAFIAGILALCLNLPFMSSRLKKMKYQPPLPAELIINRYLMSARGSTNNDRYQESLHYSLTAVQEKAKGFGKKFGLFGDIPSIIKNSLGDVALKDYWILASTANDATTSYKDSENGMVTANVLINALSRKEESYYASLKERILAFMIDLVITAIIAISLDWLISPNIRPSISLPLWIFSCQLVYFTIFEYKFSATIGKIFLRIKVSLEDGKMDFITSFARNVIRFVDMIFGFYLISILLIALSSKHQRIGDMVAKTIVTKSSSRIFSSNLEDRSVHLQ